MNKESSRPTRVLDIGGSSGMRTNHGIILCISHGVGIDPTESPRGLPPRKEFSPAKVAMQKQADIYLGWYRTRYESGQDRVLPDLETIAASFQVNRLVDEHIRQRAGPYWSTV